MAAMCAGMRGPKRTSGTAGASQTRLDVHVIGAVSRMTMRHACMMARRHHGSSSAMPWRSARHVTSSAISSSGMETAGIGTRRFARFNTPRT